MLLAGARQSHHGALNLLLPVYQIMKHRLLFSIIAASGLSLSALQGATVDVAVTSAGPSPKFVDSLGNFLNFGADVRVGIFNTSAPGSLATLQTSNDYNAVNSLFTPLAENMGGGGSVSESGTSGTNLIVNNLLGTGNVFGSITGIDSAFCTPGTELAVWVFNNSDPTQATEWGIFTTTNGWEFPAATVLGGSSTLNTNEIDTVIRGGTVGANYSLSNVSTVPEPGSCLLLALGSVLIVRRRRSGSSLQ